MRHRPLALLSLTVFLAACVGTQPSEEPADPNAPVSGDISFLVWGEPEELKAYRGVVEAFADVEPDVEVNLIETSDRDDLLARLGTSFAGGTPPDIFLLNYRFYGQFAARGVLEPLEERINASQAFQQEDFFPHALEAFRWNDVLTCLPQNISSLVVYYNKEALQRSGLREPRAGWTWDEMVSMAKRMTLDNDGDGTPEQYGLGVEASIIRLAPFLWSNGGDVVDDLNAPTRLTVDTPEALEVLEEFLALRQQHGVIPTDEELEAEDDETRFLNGRTAMVLASRRETPLFRTITDFDWDVAPLPRFQQPAGILHSDAYCMAKASENKEAAWSFIEFALGPEGQKITAEAGRTVPSLVEVANSEAFLDPNAKPANSEVFLETIPIIQRLPTISTWPEIEDASEVILGQGMYAGLPAEEVARQLIEETEAIFARAET